LQHSASLLRQDDARLAWRVMYLVEDGPDVIIGNRRVKEIAKRMEISFKATESLLFRARLAFREAYESRE